MTQGGVASGAPCSPLLSCRQGARAGQLSATALLPVAGDPGGAAPATAAAAAAAPGLPASRLGGRLQLHAGQQLRQVLLPHAAVHQRAASHLEAPPSFAGASLARRIGSE